jgi:pyruvate/2-oxoglutarate dehydrogenase complex dihydrolipoamide acyltransferase (E2) component
MVVSRRTSAHVHSVFEVNFQRVAQVRDKHKAEFERAGVKLTYLSFIVKAAIDALRAVPIVNASVDGDTIVYHQDVNIGIAVALDWGLIVPVIKHADEKNLLGLSRAVAPVGGSRAEQATRRKKSRAAPSRSRTPACSVRLRNADHQSAAGGHPRRGQDRAPVVIDGCDRDPSDGLSHARLRPPGDRWSGC